MPEVIPMRRKAYGSVDVNDVNGQELVKAHPDQNGAAGVDLGKYQLMAVPRWSDGHFVRPWRVSDPDEIPLWSPC